MGKRGHSPHWIAACGWALIVFILVLSVPAVADEGKDESGKGGKHQEEHAGGGNPKKDSDASTDETKSGSSDESTSNKQDSGTSKTTSGGGGDTSGTSSAGQEQGTGHGNIPCSQVLGAGAFELKLQNPGDGTFSDGTLTVTIDRTGEGTFTWASNIDVDAVIVKGGEVSNIYRLPGTNDVSGSATTARNPSNNQPYGLSHISFCYDLTTTPPPPPPCVDDPNTPQDECNSNPPPPPCVDDPSTPMNDCTSTPPTPCVDDMATPTDECNPPDGDDDLDDDVLGDILSNQGEDDVGAQGPEARPPSSGALPMTGASVFTLIVLGLTMIATGVGAVVTRRRPN